MKPMNPDHTVECVWQLTVKQNDITWDKKKYSHAFERPFGRGRYVNKKINITSPVQITLNILKITLQNKIK